MTETPTIQTETTELFLIQRQSAITGASTPTPTQTLGVYFKFWVFVVWHPYDWPGVRRTAEEYE